VLANGVGLLRRQLERARLRERGLSLIECARVLLSLDWRNEDGRNLDARFGRNGPVRWQVERSAALSQFVNEPRPRLNLLRQFFLVRQLERPALDQLHDPAVEHGEVEVSAVGPGGETAVRRARRTIASSRISCARYACRVERTARYFFSKGKRRAAGSTICSSNTRSSAASADCATTGAGSVSCTTFCISTAQAASASVEMGSAPIPLNCSSASMCASS
jgi:hypothetical protein